LWLASLTALAPHIEHTPSIPQRFFIITETKKLRTIEKKVAEDQEGGGEDELRDSYGVVHNTLMSPLFLHLTHTVEVCEGYFNYFLLTSKDREEFLRYVKGRHAADPAP
jgi:hypothetical protein